MFLKKTVVLGLCLTGALLAQGPRGGRGFDPNRGPGGPGGPEGGRGRGVFGGPQALVTGAPYSATEVTQSQTVLADGNTITKKHQMNVFRDGQGRIRTEETITPPAGSGKQPYTLTTILDYVGGNRYVLDSSTMTAYQSPLRTPPPNRAGAGIGAGTGAGAGRNGGNNGPGMGPMARRPGGMAPQTALTTLAPQSVNGLMATGTHHSQTIPAGEIGNERPIQVTRTTWMSSELKVPVQIKSSDPRFGSTTMDLTNVTQSEPSPSLFMVPGGYTVKTGGGPGGPGGGPGGPGGPGPRGPGAHKQPKQ